MEKLDLIKKAYNEVIAMCENEGLIFEFVGAHVIFDKEGEDVENVVIGYGQSGELRELVDNLENKLEKREFAEFINW